VMVVDPKASDEVTKIAEPPLSVRVPRRFDPTMKDIVSPSGGVPKPELMLAVKVTVWPRSDGFTEDVTTVIVVLLFTPWTSKEELLPKKFASPPYNAVIVMDPSGRAEVLKLAVPPLRVAVLKIVDPRLNVTIPVGVPPNWPETVAVNVTVCPRTEGLTEDVSTVVVGAGDCPSKGTVRAKKTNDRNGGKRRQHNAFFRGLSSRGHNTRGDSLLMSSDCQREIASQTLTTLGFISVSQRYCCIQSPGNGRTFHNSWD
jgi:hypothetical protein